MNDRRPTTLFQLLDAQADALGDRTFLNVDQNAVSYAGLRDRCERVAGGLHHLGLRRGDRVAVLTENSIELVVTFFACARLGLVLVPLNMYLRGEFLHYQLAKSGAAAAVVDGPGLDAVQAIERPLSLRHLIVIGTASGTGELAFDALLDTAPAKHLVTPDSSEPAAIIFTSGTTGMPKGCVIPHGVFTRWHPVHQDAGYIVPGDVVITPSPMFHQGFLGAMLTPALWAGASVHAMRQFRASTFMATARDIGATVIYAVGTIGMLLLAQAPGPDDADPGRLRVALLPPMPPDSQRAFEKRYNVPVVADSYGQTEVLVIAMSGVHGPRKPGSAGRPVPHVELAVVDDDDTILPTGQVGEIVVRPRVSGTFFSGYWEDPGATLATWRNLWHHTGDLGRQDEDGTLWIVDRKKDAVRRRGENVSSVELENAIRLHPSVKEVAVHAVPSDIGDDEIKACLVLQPDTNLEPTELFAYFKRTLPYFAVPRYVEFFPELPVNAVGRVTKMALRERGVTSETLDLETLGLKIERDERRGTSPSATRP